MLWKIPRKSWVLLFTIIQIVAFQYPLLFWPMQMAAPFQEKFGWSVTQTTLLIGIGFFPNIFCCIIFGVLVRWNPEALLLGTLIIAQLSGYWLITAISNGDYWAAVCARAFHCIGALNAANISFYQMTQHFSPIDRTTFAFGIRSFLGSLSESLAFILLGYSYDTQVVSDPSEKGYSFDAQGWYCGVCVTIGTMVWILWMVFSDCIKDPEPELPQVKQENQKNCFSQLIDQFMNLIGQKLEEEDGSEKKSPKKSRSPEAKSQAPGQQGHHTAPAPVTQNPDGAQDPDLNMSGDMLHQSAQFDESNRVYTPVGVRQDPTLPYEELFQSYNQDCDENNGLKKKYDLGSDLPERLSMVSSSTADNSTMGKLVEEEISWRVIGEIPFKGWLMLSLFATSVSCMWLVLALFPAILQFKYGFSVDAVGVIMARLPFIEAFAKLVGVLYAMNYGKRGFTIMVTSMLCSMVFLAMQVVPASDKGLIEVLLGLIAIPMGLYFSIQYNSLTQASTERTVSVAIGLSMALSNLTLCIFPVIYGLILAGDGGEAHPENGLMFIFAVLFFGTITAVFLYIVDLEGNSKLDMRETTIPIEKSPRKQSKSRKESSAEENAHIKILDQPIQEDVRQGSEESGSCFGEDEVEKVGVEGKFVE